MHDEYTKSALIGIPPFPLPLLLYFTLLYTCPSPGLFVMCGAIIYTVMSPQSDQEENTFGYAYVLAWVSFPLCLISGLIYIILRKRE